jgi:hypothetical protein
MYAHQQHQERQQEAFTQHIIETVAALSQFIPPSNQHLPSIEPAPATVSQESTTVNTPDVSELGLEFISGEFAEELEKALTEISSNT